MTSYMNLEVPRFQTRVCARKRARACVRENVGAACECACVFTSLC